jgi:hypothetical protein
MVGWRAELIAMRDGFDLRDHSGMPAAGDGNDFALVGAGIRPLWFPVIGYGVALLVREGAIHAGAQPDAGEQTAKSSDDENDPLNDTRAEGVLQVTMLYPAKQMLFGGDADAATNNEPERRQHEPVAPRMQGANEGPGKACDDKCNDAAK